MPLPVKKTLHAGRGRLPDYVLDDKAIFDYEVWVPNVDVAVEGFPEDKDLYTVVDTTKKPWPHGYGKRLELIFGKKFQLPVMETCLRSMLVDEVAQFDISTSDMVSFPIVAGKLRDISRAEVDKNYDKHKHAKQAHHCAAMGPIKTGYDELDDLITNPRPIRLVIHLHDVVSTQSYKHDSWQLDDTAKLAATDSLRTEGNALFKQHKFDEAKEKYREALTLLDKLLLKEKPGDPEWKELDDKNIPLYLNLTQCYLNLGSFYEAAGAAEEVLKRDPTSEKGLCRRARARMAVWDLDGAGSDFKRMQELYPSSAKLVQQELALLAAKRAEKLETDKSVSKAMLQAFTFKK